MTKYLAIALFCIAISATAKEGDVDCDNAASTLDRSHCESLELDDAERELKKYLDKSLSHHKSDTGLVDAIVEAQLEWRNYREAHCDAVYHQWRDGSIRKLKTLSCEKDLTRLRTYELWKTYLTFMDSTAPVLPKPDYTFEWVRSP